MGALQETATTLRFFGPTLDPNEVTALLQGEPTAGVAAGGTWLTSLGREKTAKEGSWRLETVRREPGDLDGQIAELLDQLTSDLGVWVDLTSRYRADIFCGLFLVEHNEGISISSETALKIGQRGLKLDLDIYVRD